MFVFFVMYLEILHDEAKDDGVYPPTYRPLKGLITRTLSYRRMSPSQSSDSLNRNYRRVHNYATDTYPMLGKFCEWAVGIDMSARSHVPDPLSDHL